MIPRVQMGITGAYLGLGRQGSCLGW